MLLYKASFYSRSRNCRMPSNVYYPNWHPLARIRTEEVENTADMRGLPCFSYTRCDTSCAVQGRDLRPSAVVLVLWVGTMEQDHHLDSEKGWCSSLLRNHTVRPREAPTIWCPQKSKSSPSNPHGWRPQIRTFGQGHHVNSKKRNISFSFFFLLGPVRLVFYTL